jgi:hypothetical protein
VDPERRPRLEDLDPLYPLALKIARWILVALPLAGVTGLLRKT